MRLPEDAANGEVTPSGNPQRGGPECGANATGVRLRDANPDTPDARITRAVGVCNSVVNVIDAVPLPF